MRRLLPLALSLCALPACGGRTPSTPPAAAAATPTEPATANALAASTMTLAETGIVPAWLDRQADACQDFYDFACGGFLATAQIPPDRASWSAITVVMEQTEGFLRQVLEKAAREPGTDRVMAVLGDYYAACMDEEAIEKAGTTPLAPFLTRIGGVTSADTAAQVVVEL